MMVAMVMMVVAVMMAHHHAMMMVMAMMAQVMMMVMVVVMMNHRRRVGRGRGQDGSGEAEGGRQAESGEQRGFHFDVPCLVSVSGFPPEGMEPAGPGASAMSGFSPRSFRPFA